MKCKLFIIGLLCLFMYSGVNAQRIQKPEYRRFNPHYHFYPSGDPTGLFYYDGKYYNAWGRYYGTDFVHWTATDASRKFNELRARLTDVSVSQEEKDEIRRKTMASRLGGSGSIVVDEHNVVSLAGELRRQRLSDYAAADNDDLQFENPSFI